MNTPLLRFVVSAIVGFCSALSLEAMDVARVEARVDEAVARFAFSGQGVIIVVLDRGSRLEERHSRNEDGTTRIKWIFDVTDDTGANAPGNTYGIGMIYTESQINAALSGGPPLATRDAAGHRDDHDGHHCSEPCSCRRRISLLRPQ